MIKHIGRHNNRKVVILFRQVPGEDHMCLISYSDQLPQLIHDEVMKTLESQIGQQSDNFADALFRQTLADGRNALDALHKEGLMKKVQTSQVIVTPNANSSVRLDELNSILSEMAKGEEAVKKLADIDKNRGIVAPKNDLKVDTTTLNESLNPNIVDTGLPVITDTSVLSDADIAASQRAQAAQMRKNAEAMLAEATRLEQEASILVPTATETVKSTRGRKPRATAQGGTEGSSNKKVAKNDSAKKATKA